MFERGLTYTKTITMITEHCCNCGVIFGITSDMQDDLKNTKKQFYCPNGHSQHYTGKSDSQKLKELESDLQRKKQELEIEKRNRISAEHMAEKLNKKLKRVHNGVCPCCNRSFENLRRHMETKHPAEFKNFIELINSGKDLKSNPKLITEEIKKFSGKIYKH